MRKCDTHSLSGPAHCAMPAHSPLIRPHSPLLVLPPGSRASDAQSHACPPWRPPLCPPASRPQQIAPSFRPPRHPARLPSGERTRRLRQNTENGQYLTINSKHSMLICVSSSSPSLPPPHTLSSPSPPPSPPHLHETSQCRHHPLQGAPPLPPPPPTCMRPVSAAIVHSRARAPSPPHTHTPA